MLRFLEHRIADRRLLRLVQKWMSAGVIENGEWSETVEGTGRKGHRHRRCSRTFTFTTSFDVSGAIEWRERRQARGEVIIVRFADDDIVGFEHREDAERFLC